MARVVVPASAANLGPGFDSFGLALGLYNTLEGELAPSWHVEVGGEGAGRLPTDESNPVALAMSRAFAEAGRPDLAAEVSSHNGIPVGRGLGSSAAAIVGGLLLGDRLAGAGMSRHRMLELAAEMEGHADNVAAALYGGFVVTAGTPAGLAVAPVDPAGGIAAIVVLGDHELPTAVSREALPETVPHADAAANAARASMLALGLALGVPAYVSAGMHDSLHEPYRIDLVPDLVPVRELLLAIGAGPAVLSGAGPSVLALIQEGTDDRALARARRLAETARIALESLGRGRILALAVDRTGATCS